jgi:hypothetical protein
MNTMPMAIVNTCAWYPSCSVYIRIWLCLSCWQTNISHSRLNSDWESTDRLQITDQASMKTIIAKCHDDISQLSVPVIRRILSKVGTETLHTYSTNSWPWKMTTVWLASHIPRQSCSGLCWPCGVQGELMGGGGTYTHDWWPVYFIPWAGVWSSLRVPWVRMLDRLNIERV